MLNNVMDFRSFLEADLYQKMFPFMTEEDPPNIKKMRRYKNMDNYVRAMSKGGKDTEVAAEKLISAPADHWFAGGPEELLEIVPGAFVIPSYTFPGGRTRPEWKIAFVHLKTKDPVNPNNPEYNRPRHRILAYWQGRKDRFTKENVFDGFTRPIGGLSFVGSYIDTVWIDPEYRGSHPDVKIPSLYKALREFAKRRGAVSLKPEDDLTSKSYRAAQAKYDWKRAGMPENDNQ